MTRVIREIINLFANKPKILFLADSAGAILTAFFLFIILRSFKEYFGMPQTILTYLSAIAVILFIYSASCLLILKGNWTPFIKVVGIANLLYCCLTAGLLVNYFPILTAAGVLYFLVEITVICGLVYLELKTATVIEQNKINAHV